MKLSSFTIIDTPRLWLRRLIGTDLDHLVAYRNDPEVSRYQAWNGYTQEQALDMIAEMQQTEPGVPGRWFQIGVEHKEAGHLAGDIGMRTDSYDPALIELGFTLARPFWGQGIAREALTHLLAYVFRDMNMHRVIATTDTRNERSRHLLEQLGFRREGHFRQSFWSKGEWCDEYQYALLQDEWQ